MYLNKVAFSEMIWRKTINLLPNLVQYKNKRGLCVFAKGIKNVGKMKVPGFFRKDLV